MVTKQLENWNEIELKKLSGDEGWTFSLLLSCLKSIDWLQYLKVLNVVLSCLNPIILYTRVHPHSPTAALIRYNQMCAWCSCLLSGHFASASMWSVITLLVICLNKSILSFSIFLSFFFVASISDVCITKWGNLIFKIRHLSGAMKEPNSRGQQLWNISSLTRKIFYWSPKRMLICQGYLIQETGTFEYPVWKHEHINWETAGRGKHLWPWEGPVKVTQTCLQTGDSSRLQGVYPPS